MDHGQIEAWFVMQLGQNKNIFVSYNMNERNLKTIDFFLSNSKCALSNIFNHLSWVLSIELFWEKKFSRGLKQGWQGYRKHKYFKAFSTMLIYA